MPLENARLVAALLIALVALVALGVWAHLEPRLRAAPAARQAARQASKTAAKRGAEQS